jgi:diadenosine tetraphosphate (Ap4A) HIT family hydrolase
MAENELAVAFKDAFPVNLSHTLIGRRALDDLPRLSKEEATRSGGSTAVAENGAPRFSSRPGSL